MAAAAATRSASLMRLRELISAPDMACDWSMLTKLGSDWLILPVAEGRESQGTEDESLAAEAEYWPYS